MKQTEKQQIEKIKNTYISKPNEKTKFQELKDLDKKIRLPVHIFAYVYGIIGALVLGTGMCFAMKILGNSVATLMPVGIVIGLVGILMISTTYSIYKRMLNKRKAKFSDEIIKKSNELLNEGEQ